MGVNDQAFIEAVYVFKQRLSFRMFYLMKSRNYSEMQAGVWVCCTFYKRLLKEGLGGKAPDNFGFFTSR